ncbi:DUF262 domain-containing protein [Methylobacterium sp. 1973]|uniref:DUF262 domain-containing protein n=1 Tax=Methylobacterium sp. 1973 TaxID=3156421 RepID=UPI003399B7CB
MPQNDFESSEILDAVDRARRDVRYLVTDYPVETLIRKLKPEEHAEEGDIYVPNYQRTLQWGVENRSYFIESLILRVPIPPIFFYETQGRLEIVDGSQRIRSLAEFMNNGFKLTGLEKLDVLNGLYYDEIPKIITKRLLNSPIRSFVLEEGTDERTRIELFRRINTTSKQLSEAEIRKGAYQGPFLDLVIDCANRETFKQLAPGVGTRGNRNAESERQELVTRFFIYSDNYLEFRHDVRKFLDAKFMHYNRVIDEVTTARMSNEFDEVMAFIDHYMPRAFFRDERRSQVPRVRFEAIAIGACLALRINPELDPEDLGWLESADFTALTRTDASNSGPKLRARVEYVRDRLLENL